MNVPSIKLKDFTDKELKILDDALYWFIKDGCACEKDARKLRRKLRDARELYYSIAVCSNEE